jgi:hypothetical protein
MAAFDFGVTEFRGEFFDASAVLKEMDKVRRQTLSRFGAYARRRMKSSLKYAKGKSSAGSPPHVHTASGFTRAKTNKKTGATARQSVSPLRELLYFAYDAGTESVVVGPAKFGGAGGVAPGLLEKGGPGTFPDSRTGQIKAGVWAPRPFVEPAGEAEVASGAFLVPR